LFQKKKIFFIKNILQKRIFNLLTYCFFDFRIQFFKMNKWKNLIFKTIWGGNCFKKKNSSLNIFWKRIFNLYYALFFVKKYKVHFYIFINDFIMVYNGLFPTLRLFWPLSFSNLQTFSPAIAGLPGSTTRR